MEAYKYIKCHENLNPKLWTEGELKSEVKEKLFEIADSFINSLRSDNVPIYVSDLLLVGSNVNYNYNINSDIDLHIIVSNDVDDTLLKLYNSYRSNFNKTYTPMIYGYEVEIYIESIPSVSNGKYSLLNGWIQKPVKEEIKINAKEINSLFDEYVNEYNELKEKISFENKDFKIAQIDNLLDKIYQMRQTALKNYGEFSTGNMVFKELRAKGYIETLREKKKKIVNSTLSLE